MTHEILIGDCLEVMKTFPDNHFTGIVTDPPYGLHFMGKDWDNYAKGKCKIGRMVPGKDSNSEAHEAARYDDRRNDEFECFMRETASQALRILKPGGHVLMFGAPRRFHRQICALEDAGFQIRDCMSWLYGSGFPKSHNKFGVPGFGTALKPAWEPIIVAMKPLDGTFKQNAEKWGVAGLNIDGCRIGTQAKSFKDHRTEKHNQVYNKNRPADYDGTKGRWPANVILDEEAGALLDEQSGVLKSGSMKPQLHNKKNEVYGKYRQASPTGQQQSTGGASRFFYCAKASSRERNEGLEDFPDKTMDVDREGRNQAGFNSENRPTMLPRKNTHPTVKPLKLMEYLLTLIAPPQNALILDPFAGSGSTIVVAKRLGIPAIGIEKSQEYAEIAKARVNAAKLCERLESDQMELAI